MACYSPNAPVLFLGKAFATHIPLRAILPPGLGIPFIIHALVH
jgi:hypothetical protein